MADVLTVRKQRTLIGNIYGDYIDIERGVCRTGKQPRAYIPISVHNWGGEKAAIGGNFWINPVPKRRPRFLNRASALMVSRRNVALCDRNLIRTSFMPEDLPLRSTNYWIEMHQIHPLRTQLLTKISSITMNPGDSWRQLVDTAVMSPSRQLFERFWRLQNISANWNGQCRLVRNKCRTGVIRFTRGWRGWGAILAPMGDIVL